MRDPGGKEQMLSREERGEGERAEMSGWEEAKRLREDLDLRRERGEDVRRGRSGVEMRSERP